MKVVKAAAVQLSPVLYSREQTIEKIVGKIHELGQQGVKFVTFPETVVPYYPYFSFIQARTQPIAHGRSIVEAYTKRRWPRDLSNSPPTGWFISRAGQTSKLGAIIAQQQPRLI